MTSLPEPVREYLKIVEDGEYRVCKEQTALAALIRKIFEGEELTFDGELFAAYMRLEKYFPFDLFPWERFLTALWDCTFSADGFPRFRTVFAMVGRGSGKDGYIAFNSACNVSPYNPVERYDVDICANNEEQAKRPVLIFRDILETPKNSKLAAHYQHTLELIKGRKNKGTIKGRTNNPKSRDGMQSGKIIFNEVHQYEDYANINVFKTGLGKVAQPRIGIFSSNGEVNDGPLDDYLAESNRILFEGEPDRGFLPFICRLPNKEAVHDPANWFMANPSLRYMPHLLREIEDEYHEWVQAPIKNSSFLIKRMGVRSGFTEVSVTDYEKVLLTKKELPIPARASCVVGVDYAELNDWAAVNAHFRVGDARIDINHAWICRDSKTLALVKAPWRDWCEQGHATFVDDVTISPDLLAEYIAELGRTYNVRMLAMDNFRWTLVSEAFKRIGFDASDKRRVKLIRPSDIMQVDSVIQTCFDRELFNWGNNPVLRWAVGNTKRVKSSKRLGVDTGNYIYAKIEAKSRKTDPFMALVASMVCEPILGSGQGVALPPVGAVKI